MPAPLPPRLTFTRELAVALSRADAALGTLSGLAGELPSPAAMAAPFLRQEALCSTRIEGADVGLTEVLLHEISAAPADSGLRQLDEVRNVLATLMYGIESVATRPLDLGLIRSLHERSLRGEPATARTPGEFRTTQNWIGPPGSTLATATYVPPPVPEMLAGLDQLEGFMAERDRLPDLVQCAMAHAQFESIHPFMGGNGRLGRVLIVLFLVARGRLSLPLLYLSAYLEAHRREYYTLLQRVRTHGNGCRGCSSLPTGCVRRPSTPTCRRAACFASAPAIAHNAMGDCSSWWTSSSCRRSSLCARYGARCR